MFCLLGPPDPPSSVQLEVVGTRSLKVKFAEPETAHHKDAIVTKYKGKQDNKLSVLCNSYIEQVHDFRGWILRAFRMHWTHSSVNNHYFFCIGIQVASMLVRHCYLNCPRKLIKIRIMLVVFFPVKVKSLRLLKNQTSKMVNLTPARQRRKN